MKLTKMTYFYKILASDCFFFCHHFNDYLFFPSSASALSIIACNCGNPVSGETGKNAYSGIWIGKMDLASNSSRHMFNLSQKRNYK